MATNLKIGLIGAGRIGRLHGENLMRSVKNAEVVAVADPLMNDEMQLWAKSLGIKRCYNNIDPIMQDKEIEAVFICSSTDTHADFIVRAAKAGKQIFCEKPVHYDLDKIYQALEAVKLAGVKLQLGFVRRFDHNHKAVRDTVAKNMLGRPHIIKIASRDPEPPPMSYVKVSGGLFMDMMIHDFDMARYLAGGEVTEVSTFGAVLVDEQFKEYDDVDTAIVMLKFENGALGVIDNSRASRYGYDQRTEVHCDKGCVRVENDLANTSSISTAEGVFVEKPTWFFLERYNNAFIAEEQAFVNAVINDSQVLVDGNDGLMSVVVAMAAKKSLDEGRPVKLAEILK